MSQAGALRLLADGGASVAPLRQAANRNCTAAVRGPLRRQRSSGWQRGSSAQTTTDILGLDMCSGSSQYREYETEVSQLSVRLERTGNQIRGTLFPIVNIFHSYNNVFPNRAQLSSRIPRDVFIFVMISEFTDLNQDA